MPIDLTHTPLDFPLSGAPLHTSAADSTRYGCSWQHAKPGSLLRLLLLLQRLPRMWGSGQPLPPLQSSCRSPAWTSTDSHHHFVNCVRVLRGVANRLVTATIPYLLTRLGIASLSRTLVSRSLGHSFAFSSASCPGDSLSGGSLGLANANSATATATFCTNDSSALRAPRSFLLHVHLASLLTMSESSLALFRQLGSFTHPHLRHESRDTRHSCELDSSDDPASPSGPLSTSWSRGTHFCLS